MLAGGKANLAARPDFLDRVQSCSYSMPYPSIVSASDLVASDGLPRRLRCLGLSLSELARQQNFTLDGRDGEIAHFATLSGLPHSSEGISVTYLASRQYAHLLPSRQNLAVVTRSDLRDCIPEGNATLLVEGDAHDCFYSALSAVIGNGHYERLRGSISPRATIHATAVIGENVHVEDGAVIGPYVVIIGNTYVGPGVAIKPHATIGADGFENAIIRGRHTLVPHAGGVWLSEGVRIGSSCVDCALFGDFTFVGAFTTIDNLVHFGHSVRAGRNCALTACSEISGSTVLGDGVWLAPNSSINQLLHIGDYCYIGTGSVVTRDLPAHSLAYGSPAKVAASVCACRHKLQFDRQLATCGACGRRYRQDSAGLVQHV